MTAPSIPGVATTAWNGGFELVREGDQWHARAVSPSGERWHTAAPTKPGALAALVDVIRARAVEARRRHEAATALVAAILSAVEAEA